ncbi:MAG: YwiC-like family protein [Propionibacteriaceae bacterium]|nr:YwiC-like family protein [Propionibacteriaceae bacterium]
MSKPSPAWVPQQHGAWGMLIVPYLAGLILASRVRPLVWADLLLGLTWLIGYFAFNALSLTLKSAPRRRPAYRVPLLTYGALTGIAGAGVLLTRGWEILWWSPAYAVLLGWTLWLVAHKKERSLASGLLTVVASCGLMLVLRWATPQAILGTADPSTLPHLATAFAVTGYFAGTVFYVKALIRERKDPRSTTRSIVYHGVFALAIVGCWLAGWLSWPWALWAVALAARAAWVPGYAAAHQWRPRHIGVSEIVVSVITVVILLLG